MRKLRLLCDACGEVTVHATEIVVAKTDDSDQLRCSFRCPECAQGVEKYCDIETGRLLLMSGARTKPAEAAPLSLSDLVLLRELLDRPDFVNLMRGSR